MGASVVCHKPMHRAELRCSGHIVPAAWGALPVIGQEGEGSGRATQRGTCGRSDSALNPLGNCPPQASLWDIVIWKGTLCFQAPSLRGFLTSPNLNFTFYLPRLKIRKGACFAAANETQLAISHNFYFIFPSDTCKHAHAINFPLGAC